MAIFHFFFPEPVDILLITTHGGYFEERIKFKPEIEHVKKTYAAPIESCISLNKSEADFFKGGLSQIMTHTTDMNTKCNTIVYMLKELPLRISAVSADFGISRVYLSLMSRCFARTLLG